jgi:hypothetical protein
VKNSIEKCLALIKDYQPAGLGLKKEDDDFKTIQADVDNFLYIVRTWDDLTGNTCTGDKCLYDSDKLKLVAEQVRSYANTCTSSINKRYKKNMVKRRNSGDKTLTTTEKFLSWF